MWSVHEDADYFAESLSQLVELFKEYCQQNAVPKNKQKHLSSPPHMLQFQTALSPKSISHLLWAAYMLRK